MARLHMDTNLNEAAIRKATGTLKAAIVVTAAAILSQTKGDLEANIAAAFGHLDDFAAQIQAVYGDIPTGEIARDQAIAAVHRHIENFRQALLTIVQSPDRDGLDIFAERTGELGSAFKALPAMTEGDPQANTSDFLFDQFFLETLNELSQRDWSDSRD